MLDLPTFLANATAVSGLGRGGKTHAHAHMDSRLLKAVLKLRLSLPGASLATVVGGAVAGVLVVVPVVVMTVVAVIIVRWKSKQYYCSR